MNVKASEAFRSGLQQLDAWAPISSALALTAVHFLLLLTFLFYPSGIPADVRELLGSPLPLFSSLLLALGASFLALAMVQFAVARWPERGRVTLVLCVGLLALHFFVLQLFVFYRIKFGLYPGIMVLQDFAAAPGQVAKYGANGALFYDWVAASPIIVLSLLLCTTAVLRLRTLDSSARHPVRSAQLGSLGLLLGVVSSFVLPMNERFATENSLPITKLVMTFTLLGRDAVLANDNDLALVKPYLPRPAGAAKPPAETPQHILWVVLDSVRADHMPGSAKHRPTFPKLAARAASLQIMPRCYAHASVTRASFPVLFNARHFADIDGEYEVAPAFWQALKSSGYHTEILSADPLHWGSLRRSLGSAATDLHWSPDAADSHDDGLMVDRYCELLRERDDTMKTATVLYFVSAHFPYRRHPDFARYQPVPAQSFWSGWNDAFRPQSADRQHNAHDNSLLYVDDLLDRVLEEIAQLGRLERTLVIITADHGEAFDEHAMTFHGTTLYDEQIRVPLIFRVGEELPELRRRLGASRKDVHGLVDLIPTILEASGSPIPAAVQGISLLSDTPKPYEIAVYEHSGGMVAIMTRRRKFLFECATARAFEFDLEQDPRERVNLWQGSTRTLRAFLEKLERGGVITARR